MGNDLLARLLGLLQVEIRWKPVPQSLTDCGLLAEGWLMLSGAENLGRVEESQTVFLQDGDRFLNTFSLLFNTNRVRLPK